jgi:acyl carrier protein
MAGMLRRKPPTERLIPQGDEAFLAALAARVPEAQHALAIRLRHAIAEFAGFDARIVREDATFDDLDIGPADSIDELDFILRIEAAIGSKLPESEAVWIPNPDYVPRIQVGEFVRAACAVAAARTAA